MNRQTNQGTEMKWPIDKIFVFVKKSAAGKIFWLIDCAAGETDQKRCAAGKIFLTES